MRTNVAHPPAPDPVDPDRWSALHVALDTITHYTADPYERRSICEGVCVYRKGVNGAPEANCAIGRYLRPECPEAVWKVDGPLAILNDHYPLKDILLPEVAHLPFSFWLKLQRFHDSLLNWTASGPAPQGRLAAQDLIRSAIDIDKEKSA